MSNQILTEATAKRMADALDAIKDNGGFGGGGEGIKKRGKAVIFGDSYFDGTSKFSDYLTTQGIYASVTNFAHGGTGFGMTAAQYSGYNLYQLLEKADVQAAIRDADVIYMHLGGNDVLATLNSISGRETDIYNRVKGCMATIYQLNPSVVIYYVRSTYAPTLAGRFARGEFTGATPSVMSATLHEAFNIDRALIESQNNILFSDFISGEMFDVLETDGLHPTDDSTLALFDAVVYSGGYGQGNSLDYVVADADFTTNAVDQTDSGIIAGLFNAGKLSNQITFVACMGGNILELRMTWLINTFVGYELCHVGAVLYAAMVSIQNTGVFTTLTQLV